MFMTPKPNPFKPDLVKLITKGVFTPVNDIEKLLYDEYQKIWKGIKHRSVKVKFLTKAIEEIETMQADASEFEQEDLTALLRGAKTLIEKFIESKEVSHLQTLNTIVKNNENELTAKFQPLFLKAFSKPVCEKLLDLQRRERAFSDLETLKIQIDAMKVEEKEPHPAEVLAAEDPDEFDKVLAELKAVAEKYDVPLDTDLLEPDERKAMAKVSTPQAAIDLYEPQTVKSNATSNALRMMAAH